MMATSTILYSLDYHIARQKEEFFYDKQRIKRDFEEGEGFQMADCKAVGYS